MTTPASTFGWDYWLLISGQIVSQVGDRFQSLAIPMVALAASGNPRAAGLILGLTSITSIAFGIVAGAIVDRLHRRHIMVGADLLRSTLSIALGVTALAHTLPIGWLYAFAIAYGLLSTLFNAANAVAIPNIVPREKIPDALGLYRALGSVIGIAGSSVAGVVYVLGAGTPFIINGAALLVSALTLCLIRVDFRDTTAQATVKAEARHFLTDVWEGLVWLGKEPVLRTMTLVEAADAVRYGAGYLMLIELAQTTGSGATGVGIVFAGAAAGGVLGGSLAGTVSRRFPLGKLATAMIVVEAVSFPLYGLAPRWYWLVPVAAFESIVSPIYVVALETYRVNVTPDAVRGRVISGMNVVTGAAGALGAAASGTIIDAIGARGLVWVASAWMGLLALLVLGNHSLRNADS